ncbi:MAG: exodeoxyribonuclease VII large subunit [Muribaculaceae bacterium]|nr:exodeoxyribonuclease VII large subunit [Muribaculaceae bacterium]
MPADIFSNETPQALTLSQLNGRIRALLNDATVQGQWVLAETSDVQQRRGHCYLELVEKDAQNGAIVAKAQAVIWANVFARLSVLFQQVTGSPFGTGMKVMVRVSASFHEQYGMKLVISDINPDFTLGDMARQRKEIIERLTREGLIELNRQLEWPEVPQRIAIISAAGAAGYGDFMNQLHNNPYGLQFYTCLFQAVMQGSNTAPSVLTALRRIREHVSLFDCVVVIRGGGSTTDLNAFDNYDMAAAIATMPIPVIVGIGHERDVTVLDYVAAMRVKTPTAAAEWLIQRGAAALTRLADLGADLALAVRDIVAHAREQLTYYASFIPSAARRVADTARLHISHLAHAIPLGVSNRLAGEQMRLAHNTELMRTTAASIMSREKMRLDALQEMFNLLSPRNILNRGYALLMSQGKFVTSVDNLHAGDELTVHLRDGRVRTVAKEVLKAPKTD